MSKIYWTYAKYKHNTEQYVGMALSPMPNGTCMNFTINDEFPYMTFSTVEQCVQYITQINKPAYYESLGSKYELVFLEPNSEDWYEVFDVWQNFYNAIEKLLSRMAEWQNMPWYKKIFKKEQSFILGE